MEPTTGFLAMRRRAASGLGPFSGSETGRIYEILPDNVQINRPLKEKLFELGSGMKVLKAE